MNSRDWTELLVSIILSLLTEYMRKHGPDQAQEVVSRVSYSLASDDNQGSLFQGSPVSIARVANAIWDTFPQAFFSSGSSQSSDDCASEKERYRVSQGTKS